MRTETISERPLKRIMVTGGAGFIGSAFIRHLLGKTNHASGFSGERVVNYDVLTYAGNLENLRSVADDARYVFVKGDICDGKAFEQVLIDERIDTVVHFAAESHVDRSIHGPGAFMQTNIMGTFAILEALRARQAAGQAIHLHHVSTDEVFGSLGDTGFFVEETPYDPRSPYSSSKAASDHIVRAYGHTYNLPYTLSNCSNNYGPFHFPEKLIPLMILNCLSGKPLPVYGDGQNIRDWLYVEDHAEGIWTVLQAAQTQTNWNIGGNNEWKNLDLLHRLIDVVAELAGKDAGQLRGLITYVKDRPGHDRRYAIDCGKITRELGWTPRHDFTSGLRATVQWYLDNPKWIANVQSGAYKSWVDTNYSAR